MKQKEVLTNKRFNFGWRSGGRKDLDKSKWKRP